MRAFSLSLSVALALAAMVATFPAGTGEPEGPVPLPSRSDARPWREVLAPAEGHTIAGDVRIVAEFPVPQLDTKRRVWIYLPPGYEGGRNRYPVLYLHDGQNVFDAKTSYVGEWKVDETLETLCAQKKTAGAIVVAVDHGGSTRSAEYVPSGYGRDPKYYGEKHAEFLAKTLKPWVDAHFRTLPDRLHTGVGGSSAGAFISFFTGTTYPGVFSKIGAFSFTVPGEFEAGIFGSAGGLKPGKTLRVCLHVGTAENISRETSAQRFVENLETLNGILLKDGFPAGDIRLFVQKDGEHNEKNWSAVFPEVFLWLYGGE